MIKYKKEKDGSILINEREHEAELNFVRFDENVSFFNNFVFKPFKALGLTEGKTLEDVLEWNGLEFYDLRLYAISEFAKILEKKNENNSLGTKDKGANLSYSITDARAKVDYFLSVKDDKGRRVYRLHGRNLGHKKHFSSLKLTENGLEIDKKKFYELYRVYVSGERADKFIKFADCMNTLEKIIGEKAKDRYFLDRIISFGSSSMGNYKPDVHLTRFVKAEDFD